MMEQRGLDRQPTILIVEDDEDTRRVYSVLLRQSGFDVVEASTGPEAVRRASEIFPDLILMDMNLPELNGWEAARRIKSDPEVRAPLVAFSAMVDSCADLRSANALFDGFIAKPVSPTALIQRVNAYLQLIGVCENTDFRTPTSLA